MVVYTYRCTSVPCPPSLTQPPPTATGQSRDGGVPNSIGDCIGRAMNALLSESFPEGQVVATPPPLPPAVTDVSQVPSHSSSSFVPTTAESRSEQSHSPFPDPHFSVPIPIHNVPLTPICSRSSHLNHNPLHCPGGQMGGAFGLFSHPPTQLANHSQLATSNFFLPDETFGQLKLQKLQSRHPSGNMSYGKRKPWITSTPAAMGETGVEVGPSPKGVTRNVA